MSNIENPAIHIYLQLCISFPVKKERSDNILWQTDKLKLMSRHWFGNLLKLQ